ncbi:hypothetical protein ACFLZC_00160 [Patescibacteria group bacterium]
MPNFLISVILFVSYMSLIQSIQWKEKFPEQKFERIMKDAFEKLREIERLTPPNFPMSKKLRGLIKVANTTKDTFELETWLGEYLSWKDRIYNLASLEKIVTEIETYKQEIKLKEARLLEEREENNEV